MRYYYKGPEDLYKSGTNAGLTYKTVFTYNPHFIEWQILNHGLYIDIEEFEKLPVFPIDEKAIRKAKGYDGMPFAALIHTYENDNIPLHLIEQVQFDEFKLNMQPGINKHEIKRQYERVATSSFRPHARVGRL